MQGIISLYLTEATKDIRTSLSRQVDCLYIHSSILSCILLWHASEKNIKVIDEMES